MVLLVSIYELEVRNKFLTLQIEWDVFVSVSNQSALYNMTYFKKMFLPYNIIVFSNINITEKNAFG